MMILCDGRLNYSSSRRRVLDEWLMLRFSAGSLINDGSTVGLMNTFSSML
jgi:hypothetical protein